MALKKVRVSRDTILFVVGLLGIAYETLIAHADRPTLLIMFGAMVGLPAFLREDEKKKDDPPPPAPAAPSAPPVAAEKEAPDADQA